MRLEEDKNKEANMNIKSMIVILLLLVSVFVVGYLSPDIIKSSTPQERFITIEAKKFSYSPEIIEVNKGDKVTINVISTDVHHGLYIDGYELKTDSIPGQYEGKITFVANKTGKFTMRCSVTCGPFHPYMISYLKVKPDYRLFVSVYLILVILIGTVLVVSEKKK